MRFNKIVLAILAMGVACTANAGFIDWVEAQMSPDFKNIDMQSEGLGQAILFKKPTTAVIEDGKLTFINSKPVAVTAYISDKNGNLIGEYTIPPSTTGIINNAKDLIESPILKGKDIIGSLASFEIPTDAKKKTDINEADLPEGASIIYVQGTKNSIAVSAISVVAKEFETIANLVEWSGNTQVKNEIIKSAFNDALKDSGLLSSIAAVSVDRKEGWQLEVSKLYGEFIANKIGEKIEEKMLKSSFDTSLLKKSIQKKIEGVLQNLKLAAAAENAIIGFEILNALVADLVKGERASDMDLLKKDGKLAGQYTTYNFRLANVEFQASKDSLNNRPFSRRLS